MSLSLSKRGLVKTNNLYESFGMNLAYGSTPGDYSKAKISYTPLSGATNSCLDGFTVNFEDCTAGEIIHMIFCIDWWGDFITNKNSSFSMWFQGAMYKKSTGAYEWNGHFFCDILNGSYGLTSLVTSKKTGHKLVDIKFALNGNFPTYTKQKLGIRTDYSNGTGTIQLSNILVNREKYYAGKGPAVRFASSSITSNNYIEF